MELIRVSGYPDGKDRYRLEIDTSLDIDLYRKIVTELYTGLDKTEVVKDFTSELED